MTEIVKGDCRAILPTLAAGRFRSCITSPPYWAQREYLPTDHPDKAMEIGREATPAEYVRVLVQVFRAVRDALADDGTLWINIGDKYVTESGGRSPGGAHFGKQNRLVDRGAIPRKLARGQVTLPPKNLLGLPWRLAFALQDDGWILRSEIIWEKPNAKPSSVTDRPTTAHEHLFLFSKSPVYFYDVDAIREPSTWPRKSGRRSMAGQKAIRPRGNLQTIDEQSYHPLGRNSRSVWRIATIAGDGEHVAPMPPELARRCLLAGSARGDEVLDPFGGSGTVGVVGAEEGRRVTLIDLDDRAVEKAKARTAQGGLLPLR